MPRLLEEFAYGNISPGEQYFKKDSEYGRAIQLVSTIEEKLMERLDAGGKDLFKKYIGAQGETSRLTAVQNFIYGYKLGLILTAEAFTGIKDLYVNVE